MNLSILFKAGLGGAGAQLISLICLPFLTRMYTPTDFAPWAVGFAFVALIGSVSTLRYDLAMVIERNHVNASALFWLVLLVSSLVFLSAGGGIVLAAHEQWLFKGTQVVWSAQLVAGWLFLFAINQALCGWHLHHGAFLIISISQIVNAAATNLVQFAGAWFAEGGAFWLVVGSILGQFAAMAILLWAGWRAGRPPAPLSACVRRLWPMAKMHRRFVIFSLPFTLFNAVRERATVLLLGAWVGANELGLYSQAWRLSNVPAGLSGSAIRPILFHGAAEKGLRAQESHIGRILIVMVLAGSPLLAVVSHRPEALFAAVLGDKWYSIGPLIAAMAFPAFAFALSNWMDRLMDAAGKQHLNLLTEVVSGVSSLAVVFGALALGASLQDAVKAQSVMLFINYLFFVYMTYRVAGYGQGILLRLLGLSAFLYLVTSMLLKLIWE